MIVAEIQWAALESCISYVLSSYDNTAQSIATDCGDTLLFFRYFCGKPIGVPFPCNGLGVEALHAESRNTDCLIIEMLQESWISIQRRNDIVFEEEDPWSPAERGVGVIDERTSGGDLMLYGSAWEIGKTLNADGKGEVRMLAIVAGFQPFPDHVSERYVLCRIDDDDVGLIVRICLFFEEFPCEQPHPFAAGK